MLLLVGLLVTAGAVAQDAKQELQKLKGTWTVVKAERNGQANDEIKDDKLILTEDGKLTVKAKDRDQEGTFEVNPTKKPKTIDVKPGSEGIVLGIYELDGDNLKLCFGRPGNDRPTAFESKPDSGVMLITLKRDK
jgi:uncharacterized protein (TIGR03067 family)